MSFWEWLSLAGICLLGAMSPGPSLAVVARHTLRGGAGHGVAAGVAHGFGVSLYALAVVSGMGAIITTSPLLYSIIQYLGAAFLVYLGLRSIIGAGTASIDQAEPVKGQKRGALLQGFGVAFLNPKLAVFFFALFSQFIHPNASLSTQVLMVATVGSIDASWYALVALLLGRPGILERLRGAQGRIDRLFGLILIAVAIRVVIPF